MRPALFDGTNLSTQSFGGQSGGVGRLSRGVSPVGAAFSAGIDAGGMGAGASLEASDCDCDLSAGECAANTSSTASSTVATGGSMAVEFVEVDAVAISDLSRK